MYSDIMIDHLANPRNQGELENPDGVGIAHTLMCHDEIVVTIQVKNDIIQDVRFKAFGCGAAIATGSVATELIKGKHIDDALKITGRHLIEAMGGVPENKAKCTLVAHDAFRAAVEDFRKKVQV